MMLSVEKIFFKLCDNQSTTFQTQLTKYLSQCQICAKACVHQLNYVPEL